MAISDEFKDLVGYLEKAIKIVEKMGMRILDLEKQSVRIKLPKEPNVNHLGTVYAGALFSLADFAGGILFFASFDYKKYYILLKEMTIAFKKPATTDMTIAASLTPDEVDGVRKIADEAGKADWSVDFELKDEQGNVCCIVHGNFQLRKL
jgi:thioesterase domain-containing protein